MEKITKESLRTLLDRRRARVEKVLRLFDETGLVRTGDTFWFLTPSLVHPGHWRVTRFDLDGPAGHIEGLDKQQVVEDLLDEYPPSGEPVPVPHEDFMVVQNTPRFKRGLELLLATTRNMEGQRNPGASGLRPVPYPLPEPERIHSNPPSRYPKSSEQPPVPNLPLGDYEKFRVRTALVRDPGWKGPSKPITSSEGAHRYVKTLQAEPVEVLLVILLDNRHRVIGVHEAGRGGLSQVAVEPRSVLQPAIAVGAAAIILVHNHPSGDPGPSQTDMDCTKAVSNAAKVLGIRVLDHIVVGERGYASLADLGLM